MVTQALHAPEAAPERQPTARLARAAAWLLGSSLSTQALRLVSNLLLTRWLAPDAFGVVALINTLYFALVMVSDLGVWQSVVRSERGLEPRFLGTAWTVQLLRSGLLAVMVLLAGLGMAGLAAQGWVAPGTVLADPRLPGLMALFSLCALIQGAESMQLACAQRALQTASLARLELLSHLVAMSVTLAVAWFSRSVWALVAGTLAGALARTMLSHGMLPGPRVRPAWEPSCAREIIGFGLWTLVSSVIGFLAAHGEKLLLASLLGSASFGVYAIAALLLAAVVGLYGSLNGHVVFAALSEAVRQGPAEVARVHVRVQRVADCALGLLAGGLMAAGGSVVQWLYDDRYHDAGWMLQILAIGLVALRCQVIEQLMFALGRPARVSANNLARALALLALVPLGHALAGERGAVLAVAISQFAGWPSALHFQHQQGLWRWRGEGWWLAGLAMGFGFASAFAFVLQRVLP